MKCKGQVQNEDGSFRPCKKAAVRGRDYCNTHGGRVPMGSENGSYKHGIYRKALAPGLEEAHDAALADPTILEQLEEIAVMRSMVMQMLESGESGAAWKELSRAVNATYNAWKFYKDDAMQRHLQEVREVVEEGTFDESHRDEIFRRFGQIGRVVDREHKHRVDERYALTHESMMLQAQEFVEIVLRHVDDPKIADAFVEDVRKHISARRADLSLVPKSE